MTVKRKLTTIFCADVVGYSRLMGVDEPGTLKRLKSCRELMAGFIEHHHGRVVSWSGDAVLADFASVVEAVQCAIEVQRELKARNETIAIAERMEFRVGVNLGDVMIEDHDIFGEGVNIAARLQGIAPSGGILISGSVYEQVKNKLSVAYDFLGHQQVKNIADQVPAYVVLPERPVIVAAEAVALGHPFDVAADAGRAGNFALRLGAGMIDAAIAAGIVFAVAIPLQSAGLPIADISLPFNALSTERVVSREDPSTEIRDGGSVVVTKSPSIVNRTLLGISTQTYRVTEIETVKGGATRRETDEHLIDAGTKQTIAVPSVFWFVGGVYLLMMVLTEGTGKVRRSPGKSLFGLKIEDKSGRPLGLFGAIVRNFAKTISALPLFAGFLLPLWSKRSQMLHDIAAGAQVSKR